MIMSELLTVAIVSISVEAPPIAPKAAAHIAGSICPLPIRFPPVLAPDEAARRVVNRLAKYGHR